MPRPEVTPILHQEVPENNPGCPGCKDFAGSNLHQARPASWFTFGRVGQLQGCSGFDVLPAGGTTITGGTSRDCIYLIGGDPTDYASARRIEAFRDVLSTAGTPALPEQIIACGYAPRSAMREIAVLCDRLGGLPASLTAFEGVLGHLSDLPLE
jgi:hypothetical protein